MTFEELQRSMEFIVQQQAQFTADIQKEREERLRNEVRDQPRIARVERCVVLLTELAEIGSRRIDRLDQITKRLPEEN